MKYCLSIGLHNLYFDIAIVDENNTIMGKNRVLYDRSKDVSNNIKNAYLKYFSKYKLYGIGVAISSNISYKDDVIYSLKALNIDRYNLKQAMEKIFKINVLLVEERYAASIGVYNELDVYSLAYVILDNKISNSVVVDGEVVLLDNEFDLLKNKKLNQICGKNNLKTVFLQNNLDDEYIGGYFLSNNSVAKGIIMKWAKELNKHLNKLFNSLRIEKVVFAGNLGVYYPYFKDYLKLNNFMKCDYISDHNDKTIKGVSHLIFKDN